MHQRVYHGNDYRKDSTMEQEKVTWTLGYTLQPRAFESLRIDCEIQGFRKDNETIQEASQRVYKMVETQLIEKLKEAREELS
jgi:hypothetical protein